jgi:phosphatidate phosphatase APP1
MANVYNCLSFKGVNFHYVSAGPYQMLPTLKTYLHHFSFPRGIFLFILGSLNLRIMGETGPAYKYRTILKIIEVLLYFLTLCRSFPVISLC